MASNTFDINLVVFKKKNIMDNARNLKQQQIARFRGIGMSHDLPPKERADQTHGKTSKERVCWSW